MFATDTDLLPWEPNIFHDAAFASQQLLAGTATLAGTSLAIADGSLSAAHIAAGQVVVLSGAIAGSYPIVSVEDDTHLTLSVLYDGVIPGPGLAAASPIGTGTDLPFAIRTFSAQRKVVSDLISRAAGVEPDGPAAILNPQALRRPCVLGTLQMIYSALAAASPDEAGVLSIRADLYERLYRRSLAQARVELDFDGDGKPDTMRRLNVTELLRA